MGMGMAWQTTPTPLAQPHTDGTSAIRLSETPTPTLRRKRRGSFFCVIVLKICEICV